MWLPAKFSAIVPVEVTKVEDTALAKPLNNLYDTPQVEDALVRINEDSFSTGAIVNISDTTCELKSSTSIGEAVSSLG